MPEACATAKLRQYTLSAEIDKSQPAPLLYLIAAEFLAAYFPEEQAMPAGAAVKPKKKKKSVLKNIRQTERRTAVNRSNRTAVRTAVKELRALIGAGKLAEARQRLPQTHAALDRAIQQRVLHENTANRQKSRLTLALNRAQAGAAEKKTA